MTLEYFHCPQKKPHALCRLLPQPWPPSIYFLTTYLPLLDISGPWDNIICGTLRAWLLSQWKVFKVFPCWERVTAPLYGLKMFPCTATASFVYSVVSSDIWVSTLLPRGPMLLWISMHLFLCGGGTDVSWLDARSRIPRSQTCKKLSDGFPWRPYQWRSRPGHQDPNSSTPSWHWLVCFSSKLSCWVWKCHLLRSWRMFPSGTTMWSFLCEY